MTTSPQYDSALAKRLELPAGSSSHLTIAAAMVVCWLFACLSAAGSSTLQQRLMQPPPAEQRLQHDMADGRLQQHDLVAASLISAGVTQPEPLQQWHRTFRLAASEAPRINSKTLTGASELFTFMHRRLLRGRYETSCSRVQTTLRSGDYNCVTATILYCALCRQQGIQCTAIAAPAHVYCQVTTDDGICEVETTCPTWFAGDAYKRMIRDPRDPRQRSPRHRPGARTITPVQLIAKVYYNEGLAWLELKRYSAALTDLAISVSADPGDKAAAENLLAGINNWALHLCDQRQYQSALELIDCGVQRDAAYPPFQANDLHIHQRWVQALCQQGQFRQALGLLEAGHRRRPNEQLFDVGRFAVCRDWALHEAGKGRVDSALQLMQQMESRYSRRPQFAIYQHATFAKGAEILYTQGQPDTRRWVQAGQRRFPESRDLQNWSSRLTAPRP